jgi:SpoVK/Ycf46/Vps4 family AAA+-type ATPase
VDDSEQDPVLGALLAALAAEDRPELRAAIGRHLLETGAPNDALLHLQTALTQRPADPVILEQAARAAEQAGENELAAGYRTVLDALGGTTEAATTSPVPSARPEPEPAVTHQPTPTPDPDPVPVESRIDPDGEVDDDQYDTFLREVLAEEQRNRITLSDVGGLAAIKADLNRRFFLPIRNPEIQKAYGKPINGGLLLYGPPGCGKTFLARAIAGELDARFIPITLHDTLDMWMGQSERNLHQVFEQARSETPAVLFLDEIDAIGQKRSRAANASMRGVVAQLLNELDGAVERNDGIFVIGATNAPWDVDPALRRPGRFDRTVLVLPPDHEARIAILAYHLRDRPTAELDLAKVAARTANLTGADLKLVCDSAVERAMEKAVRSGRIESVDQKGLEKAAKSVKPSVGPWLETARNFVAFSNTDGLYDELEQYLSSQKR